MSHLTCKDHGKRAFVNPETGSVLHRSDTESCSFPVVIGSKVFWAPREFSHYASCLHCGHAMDTVSPTASCYSRQGNQPHVFG